MSLLDQLLQSKADHDKRKLDENLARNWDRFYHRNKGNFFKDRNWLLREFPEVQNARSMLEIGCGCGNTIIPLLKLLPELSFFGCDFSKVALGELVTRMDAECAEDAGRVQVKQVDVSQPGAVLCPCPVQVATMIFSLSAVLPAHHETFLRNAYKALEPSGILFVRDYGNHDYTKKRFIASGRMLEDNGQVVSNNQVYRHDGTASYFFDPQELERLLTEVGFEVISCTVVERRLVNLKEEIDAERFFVQAKAKKHNV